MDANDDGVADDGGVVDVAWHVHPLWAFLVAELLNDNIPVDVNQMGPSAVWELYSNREDTAHLFDFMVYGSTFKRRLNNLRKQVTANAARAVLDQLAFDTHRQNFPYHPIDAQGKRNWHGSEAEELLEEDLAEGRYPDMKPEELWWSRPEYQEFSKDVFRGHIHQSIQTAKYLHTLKTRDEEEKAEVLLAREKKKTKAAKKAAKAQKDAAMVADKAEKDAKRAAKKLEKAEAAAAKALAKADRAAKAEAKKAAKAAKAAAK